MSVVTQVTTQVQSMSKVTTLWGAWLQCSYLSNHTFAVLIKCSFHPPALPLTCSRYPTMSKWCWLIVDDIVSFHGRRSPSHIRCFSCSFFWCGRLRCLHCPCQLKRRAEVQYSTVQYSTVQYSTVQYSTVQYSTVQYSTVQYSTVQSE
jgi:hypothetical protein